MALSTEGDVFHIFCTLCIPTLAMSTENNTFRDFYICLFQFVVFVSYLHHFR